MQITSLIIAVLRLFLYALLGRLIFDYIRMFSRTWRPRGFVLYIVEGMYAITDKPTAFVRRFIPPLRLGAVSLDLSFLVLFFAVQILIGIVATL